MTANSQNSVERAFTFKALTAQIPASMINAPPDAKISDLKIDPNSRWEQASREVTVHASEIKAILTLAPNVKGQPLEPTEGVTGSVAVVPDNAKTIIVRHNAAPLFVSTSTSTVFSGESEKVELGLVNLMFAAQKVVGDRDIPVTKSDLENVLAGNVSKHGFRSLPQSPSGSPFTDRHGNVLIMAAPANGNNRPGEKAPLVGEVIPPPRSASYIPPSRPAEYIDAAYREETPQEGHKIISRRTAILGGIALFVGGLWAIDKLTELPKLNAEQKQDLIDQVNFEANKPNSNGMEFFLRGGDTEYYDGQELKDNKQEIINNIQDDTYRGGQDFDVAPDQNTQLKGRVHSSNISIKKPVQQANATPQQASRRAFFARLAPTKKAFG